MVGVFCLWYMPVLKEAQLYNMLKKIFQGKIINAFLILSLWNYSIGKNYVTPWTGIQKQLPIQSSGEGTQPGCFICGIRASLIVFLLSFVWDIYVFSNISLEKFIFKIWLRIILMGLLYGANWYRKCFLLTITYLPNTILQLFLIFIGPYMSLRIWWNYDLYTKKMFL